MSADDGAPDLREEALVSEALLLMSSQPAPSTPSRARAAAATRRRSPPVPAVAQGRGTRVDESGQMMQSAVGVASAPLPQLAAHHALTALAGPLTVDANGAHGGGDTIAHNSPADVVAQWTAAEDQIMAEAVKRFGCKWSLISAFVPGRSPASVRNRWHRMQRAARRRTASDDERESAADADAAASATRCLYQCSRCGLPKRGHSCMLTAGGAGQVQSACEVMNTIASEYGAGVVIALPPAK